VRYNGAAKVAYELAKRFSKSHEVYIASYSGYIDKIWEKEFELYRIKHKGLFSANELKELQKTIRPDLIHSHDWLGLLLKSSEVTQIATNHSNWPKSWFINPKYFASGFLQEIPHYIKLRMVDEVVCVSKYQQNIYRKIGVNSIVIYNDVDEKFFTEQYKYVDFKRPCTLFVGSIDKRKAKYLIPIIKLINKKMDIHHYIIGYPADTSLIILNNEELRKRMSVKAIRTIKRNFLWDDKAREYLNLFKKVLDNETK
jgi:glycosyltransferase involved in cell wall biosynthesis